MSERGKVIELKKDGKIAVVAFMRTEACAKCRACMAGFVESQMILEAKNGLNAKQGDEVFIELPERGFLTASVIMYLFPLIMMVAGFLGGGLIAEPIGVQKDILSFWLGIGLLALSFIAIRLGESKFKALPIFLPYVAGVITPPE